MKCFTLEKNASPVPFGCVVFVVLLLCGCSGMGPRMIDRDRFDYLSAISESWKRQTLMNLLKTRYQDMPVFLDITSVINQYSIERELSAGIQGEFYNRGEPSFVGPSVGAGGRYADRPTITYNPLSGQDFARSVMSPIPLSAILALIQSGYPADYVFRICTQAIQGLENRRTGPIGGREADPEFYELLHLFRQLANKDVIAIRTRTIKNTNKMVIVIRAPEEVDTADHVKRIGHILELDPDLEAFPVVQGKVAITNKEIAIYSRSLIQVMIEYAGYIDVPESDLSKGCVNDVPPERDENGRLLPPLLTVHNGISEPGDAYVAAPYRNHWFWIDDRDLHSKAMFSFLVFLNSLTERGDIQNAAPVISVPTN